MSPADDLLDPAVDNLDSTMTRTWAVLCSFAADPAVGMQMELGLPYWHARNWPERAPAARSVATRSIAHASSRENTRQIHYPARGIR